APSSNYSTFQASGFTLKVPDNWKKHGDENNLAFAPDGGVGNDSSGHGALAYGLTLGTSPLQNAEAATALDSATQQLISGLQQSPFFCLGVSASVLVVVGSSAMDMIRNVECVKAVHADQ